ncbi:MAG: DUF6144 family protein [Clostridia bacterium]|nr:DUF6144 family protein [Clostridia bacterium]
MDKSNITRQIRESYSSYKVGDLAVKLYLAGISQEDLDYILQDGKSIKMKPYDKLQAYLAQAMNRMEERLPMDKAIAIRQGCACCLVGKRDQLAKAIYKNNPTIESRFEALSKERYIIGGKAWKGTDGYYVSYWSAKPVGGYYCPCLKHTPTEPMNKLWCECCAGHIKHHFETALGVKATCQCITTILTSCGEDACLFRLNIVE